MTHPYRPANHAQRFFGAAAKRWNGIEVKHKVDQPPIGEQTRLVMLLQVSPSRFQQEVNIWRSRNPGAAMDLGAPDTLTDLDLTSWKPADFARISFAGFNFRGAKLSCADCANALFATGANLRDCKVGDGIELVTRTQPKVQSAPPTLLPPAAIATRGPLTPSERAEKEAAGIRAMMKR